MIAKARVQAVVDRVRPYLNADGGDIELVAVEGNSAAVPAHKSNAAELLHIKRSTIGDRITRCGLGR
jgi:hypothetical protein